MMMMIMQQLLLLLIMMMVFTLRCLWLLKHSIHSAVYVALSVNPDLGVDMCVCFFIFSSVISHTDRNPSMVHLPSCRCSGGIV